jgi:CBS domain-containing protein
MRVRDWVRPFVCTCVPEDRLDFAVRRMRDEDARCIVAVDESWRPIGIVTDRDACLASQESGRSLEALRVSDAMRSTAAICGQDEDVLRARATMKRLHLRWMPVVNRAGYLAGVLALDEIPEATGPVVAAEASALDPVPLRPTR